MEKRFLLSGSILAFLGVVAGAFGSHILKKQIDSELLPVFETAIHYQMYHSLALILVAVVFKIYGGSWIIKAGWFFLAGIIIFSGSLYILSLTGIKWFGAFTPFGGVSFLIGWVCLVIEAIKKNN